MKLFKRERRRHIRLRAHHLIKYKVIKRSEPQDTHPFIRDISAGGILFHTGEYISRDSVIEVKVNIPLHPRPLEATCRIAWIKPLRIGGFDIGAEFIKIDKEMQEFLDKKIIMAHKRK